ncbi:MAG: leucyl aminopeptidase [Micavibrio sp.]|nr:leucyl aminopeptidase [Micavibrio sp.]
MKILFGKNAQISYDTAILFLTDIKKLPNKAKMLDDSVKGHISHTLSNDNGFKAKYGQSIIVPLPKSAAYKRVLIMGIGDVKEITDQKLRQLGGKLQVALKTASAEKALYLYEEDKVLAVEKFNLIAEGLLRRNYVFDRYKTKKKEDEAKADIHSVTLDAEELSAVKKGFKEVEALIGGVDFTRDLVSMPPNDLYPESFAKIVEKELKPLGVKVTIIDEKKLLKMGAGAIMAVGQGSARQPRMVVLEYNGKGKVSKTPDLAIVGKGITFDTGGYNIKTSNMHWMQFDMGGAGIVSGVMKSLALAKSKKHVVAVLALAENMVSSNAYRPSDIIKSLSGQTIEVLNTDAEGRLAMCDAMTYVQKEYKSKKLVDIATLTGACMVALGHEFGGVFTPDDAFWAKIDVASNDTADKAWRMPMTEAWDKEVKGSAADLKNLGDGAFAGASTAAAFLKNFVEKDVSWAHFDVAGVVWSFKDGDLYAKGATGYGVDLLYTLINS